MARMLVGVLLAAAIARGDATLPATAAADADRAVAEIEAMPEYMDAVVGDGGDPGPAWRALQRIVKLGPLAVPWLRKLVNSPKPVARMAGARGFGLVRSPEGNQVLRRLLHDRGAALAFLYGCVGGTSPVSMVAALALSDYPVAELIRPSDVVVVGWVRQDLPHEAVMEVHKVLQGAAGKTLRLQGEGLPGEFRGPNRKVIAFADGGIRLRSFIVWTAKEEKAVRAAISTSGRPTPPAP